jgi:molybdate transport system ATP-binding protein
VTLELQARVDRGSFVLQVGLRVEHAVTGIFGPSGAGKSTLLHVVAGLVRPEEGRIVLDGEVFCDTAAGICLPPHSRRLGMVFQDARLFPHLRVRDNLRYGQRLVPAAARRFTLREVAELLELGPLLERWPAQLSGGEAQRVALGRAILCSPRLLLLDEPLASLDRRLKQQITPFFRRIRDATGIPMLYVSHDPRDILDLTDRFAVLERGAVLGHGALLDLVAQPHILRLLEEDGLTNLLPVTVERHAREEGMTFFRLRTGAADAPPVVVGGPLIDAPPGAELEVELRPEDVVLAGGRVEGVSIQNQIPGRIARLTATPAREICVVDIGVPVIAEITHTARRRLGLNVGSPVWCLFKTCALHGRGGSASREEA